MVATVTRLCIEHRRGPDEGSAAGVVQDRGGDLLPLRRCPDGAAGERGAEGGDAPRVPEQSRGRGGGGGTVFRGPAWRGREGRVGEKGQGAPWRGGGRRAVHRATDHGNRAPLLLRLQDHAPVDKVAGRDDGGGLEGRGVAVGGEERRMRGRRRQRGPQPWTGAPGQTRGSLGPHNREATILYLKINAYHNSTTLQHVITTFYNNLIQLQ